MKRKLKLLNEVLPKPETNNGARPAPRARVVAHAMKIAAGAALAGACSSNMKGYDVVDPLPYPVQTDGAPPDFRQDSGYGVVDPIPTPYDASRFDTGPADARIDDAQPDDAPSDGPTDAEQDAADGGDQ